MCLGVFSVAVAGLAAGVSLHLAAVLHGTMVGHLHRLADVGFPALQHLLLVQLLVHTERHQLRARQPLPGNTQAYRHVVNKQFTTVLHLFQHKYLYSLLHFQNRLVLVLIHFTGTTDYVHSASWPAAFPTSRV